MPARLAEGMASRMPEEKSENDILHGVSWEQIVQPEDLDQRWSGNTARPCVLRLVEPRWQISPSPPASWTSLPER